jgi:hypothetical protein
VKIEWLSSRGLLVVLVVAAAAAGVGLGALAAGAGAGRGLRAGGTAAPEGSSGIAEATLSAPPSGPAVPIPSPSPTPQPTPVLVPAPLTGLLVTQAAAAQPVIAAMVDDHPDARPQAGFADASIVWQAPAEGGIPRYELFFQERYPTLLGPIRSARGYFVDWASEWRAAYLHAGGSPQALDMLAASGRGQLLYNLEGLRWDGTALWRVKEGRVAPHNLFTDAAGLVRMAKAAGAVTPPGTAAWRFAPDAPPEARPSGGWITIAYPYNSVAFRYDPASNTYLRFVGGEGPEMDADTGTRVAPKNVVILRMRFGALNDGHPQKHRLEAADVGEGEAYVATNGRTIKGTWRKATSTAPTLLFGPDGQPVTLTAGQTFVQVIPLSYEFRIADGPFAPPGMLPDGGR